MRFPFAIPPGLRRDGTEGQSRGRWLYASLVRGYGADIGPILGWRKRTTNTVSGMARAIFAWRSAPDARMIAIGTHTGLYVQNVGGGTTDISPAAFVTGEADASLNTGFGGGTFGTGTFGTPRLDNTNTVPATVPFLDNWGRYLVACSAPDGRLLEWQLNTSLDFVTITNAPTGCWGVMTTQDRFLVALGASGNARLVAWCDQEDNTVWTPAATNQAGDQELDTEGGIITAVELRGQTLILTDNDAHSMTYIGPPFVMGFQRVGEGCGAISVGCVVDQGDWAIWWSRSGFWRYDGAVTPLDCPLRDLDAGLNQTQRSKITGWHNAKNNEIWWHYPSAASTENDAYISFNYRTGEWWQGAAGDLARLAGVGPGLFTFPLLTSADGFVYEHEVGAVYDGATPFARSGPILLGDGSRFMRVLGLIFDFLGSVQVKFFNRDYPSSPEEELPATTLEAGKTDVLFETRQTEVQVEFLSSTGRFGVGFLEMTPGASR